MFPPLQNPLPRGSKNITAIWWAEEGSNLRRLGHQIYSLTPLTARESARRSPLNLKAGFTPKGKPRFSLVPLSWRHRGTCPLTASRALVYLIALTRASTRSYNPFCSSSIIIKWSWRRDLNPRPAVYKTAALPTELRQLKRTRIAQAGRVRCKGRNVVSPLTGPSSESEGKILTPITEIFVTF